MEEKIRLGVVGFGVQGSNYTKLLYNENIPFMKVVGICNDNIEKNEFIKNHYPEIIIYKSYKNMIDSGNIDAIVITTPHYLHSKIAIYALNRNIHVLNEKPAGVYTKQVLKINECAINSNAKYAMLLNQRANPLYQKIKKIIDNGDIGNIRKTNWLVTSWWRPQAYYDQSNWRATWGGEGGGVLLNQSVHQLDLILWLAGIPKTVYGILKNGYQRNISVEDDATIFFDYGNDATGIFVTCTHDILGTDRFEILGDKGKIIVEDSSKCTVYRLSQTENIINKNSNIEDVIKLFNGKTNIKSLYEIEQFKEIINPEKQYIDIFNNFSRHILYNEDLIANGVEGINTVRLINAIYLSSWLDEKISLEDFDDEKYLEYLNQKILEEGKYKKII